MNEPKNIFLASVLVILLVQIGMARSDPLPEKVSKLPSNIPAEYQNAINKVLPGYKVLRNEDFLQDKDQLSNFLSPDEIAERNKRESLGYIEGRFNDDGLPDFAAWVVNRSIKQKQKQPADMPRSEKFAARLVVCLGTNTPREYKCEILPTLNGDFIDLPYWAELKVIKTQGEMPCGNQDEIVRTAFYPEGWKGRRQSNEAGEIHARILRLDYDAIGEYAIEVNDGSTLVRQADGGYLDCADAD